MGSWQEQLQSFRKSRPAQGGESSLSEHGMRQQGCCSLCLVISEDGVELTDRCDLSVSLVALM